MRAWNESPGTWELSAPESLVLRDGANADRALAVKLGLMELIARGSLRLVTVAGRNWMGRPRTQRVLAPGTKPMPTARALARIGAAVLATTERGFEGGASGRTIEDFAKIFFAGSRFNGRGYVSDVVLPALEARGYYRREEGRLLGIVPRVRWVRTPAGEDRRTRLLVMLDDGERVVARTRVPDATEAATFLAVAGAAALLMTSQYPELSRVTERLRRQEHGADGTVVAVSGGGGGPDEGPSDSFQSPAPSPSQSPDAGGLDLDPTQLGDLDLSAFDGMDSAFDAIDSGVDAGGGDGGDGGGGDGGGD